MEPRNTTLRTLYVTGHGPESARHHAMHVDKPAISHIENPETNYSALGVDIPRIVGHSEHPINYRRGSLHVDGKDDLIRDPHHPDYHGHSIHVPHYNHDSLTQGTKLGAPIQTSRDNSKVIHGNVHHRTQNTLPEAVAAIRKNPFEAHMSHRRASYSSGLNVDYPAIPTANLAGSGSTDNTNHDRPEGVRNSAINVDRAGSLDRKHCGMGVDAPALASHEIASSVCFGSKNTHAGETKNMARDSTSVASSERHYLDGDHESIFDKVKGVFHRRSSVKSSDIPATQSSISAGKGKGRAPDIVNSTALPSELSTDVPAGYEGPIPQAGPGEQVVWVKKTTQTEIYDEPEDTAVPSETQDHTSRRHSSSSSKSFFNRLRSRHSTSSSDKGKNPAR
ncbi:hypothetical protein BCR41DRAFT_199906 [Lobosporangium transversale]|uniref:Pal1 cell morphology protein-domain-containing protein n=1 Tax=Lobosporangium transversale TaxID=64571 RepID=A0A1Y2G8B4_9FUNG|nr:hypothetical protein BCR41DRAFT_199906 [Lobosporangium transversale]ORZ04169.1 hypothetical protein BCR41DRAFT_199906 [Lobosporangium transversale]|eukprot:XP_021876383.1 hypothetical protein BCR41DRAFT_199906 [Lobosporangium transversale]